MCCRSSTIAHTLLFIATKLSIILRQQAAQIRSLTQQLQAASAGMHSLQSSSFKVGGKQKMGDMVVSHVVLGTWVACHRVDAFLLIWVG